METILSTIVKYKRKEVNERKKRTPFNTSVTQIPFAADPISLRDALRAEGATGIIAEFKPRSPSAGIININAKADTVTRGYVEAGVSALSVLTDSHFFGSSFENFILARQENKCPILLKDFIVDEYQVYEARLLGADVILLIAAILNTEEVKRMASLANSLNMETILEVHSIDELDRLCPEISIVGVNNRNLKTFGVELSNSVDIAHQIPNEYLKIAESGIEYPEDVVRLRNAGFSGFLIGSRFMKKPDPAAECKKFINQLNTLERTTC